MMHGRIIKLGEPAVGLGNEKQLNKKEHFYKLFNYVIQTPLHISNVL